MIRSGIIAAALVLGVPAHAQDVLTAKQLSAPAANAMVVAALEQCQKDGYRVSAAVVDHGGNLLAFIRDSLSGPHTAESSRRKAFTSATFGRTSATFARGPGQSR